MERYIRYPQSGITTDNGDPIDAATPEGESRVTELIRRANAYDALVTALKNATAFVNAVAEMTNFSAASDITKRSIVEPGVTIKRKSSLLDVELRDLLAELGEL